MLKINFKIQYTFNMNTVISYTSVRQLKIFKFYIENKYIHTNIHTILIKTK